MDFEFFETESGELGDCRCCATSRSSDRIYVGDGVGTIGCYVARKGILVSKKRVFDGPVHGLEFTYNDDIGDLVFAVGVGECTGDSGLANDLYLKVLLGQDMDRCLCTVNLAALTSAKAEPSAFGVLAGGSYAAVGFHDGSVLLVALAFMRPGPSGRVGTHELCTANTEDMSKAVSGLHFVGNWSGHSGGAATAELPRLFVAYDTSTSDVTARASSHDGPDRGGVNRGRTESTDCGAGIAVYKLCRPMSLIDVRPELRRDVHFDRVLLDTQGCSIGCSHMCVDTEQLVVVRRKSVSVYSSAKKESEQDLLEKVDQPKGIHCLSVSEILTFSTSSYSVSDLVNKSTYCRGEAQAGQTICMAASTSSSAFLVTDSGGLIGLYRKDAKARIQQYTDRALFRPALELAAREAMGTSVSAEVARQYGDHLLSSGDEDGALFNYANAVGDLARPSLIIRKLMDACGVETLEKYLLELGSVGANNTYTDSLLISIYAKGGKADDLHVFLDARSSAERQRMAELATRSLLESNFPVAAERLARRYQCHGMYVSICMRRVHSEGQGDTIEETEGITRTVLAYIQGLMNTIPNSELHEIILTHGGSMLDSSPRAFTELLVDLCSPSPSIPEPLAVGEYVELFADHSSQCFTLLLLVYLGMEVATVVQGNTASNLIVATNFPIPLLHDMLDEMLARATAMQGGESSAARTPSPVPPSTVKLNDPVKEHMDYLTQWWDKELAKGLDPVPMLDLVRHALSLLQNRGRGGNKHGTNIRSLARNTNSTSAFVSNTAEVDAAELIKRISEVEDSFRAREQECYKSQVWLKQAGISAAGSSNTDSTGNPLLEAERRQWWKVREDQLKRSSQHDMFKRELRTRDQGEDEFAPLARMFSKVLVLDPASTG